MDYDAYAATYAWTRWALPWVIEPIWRLFAGLPSGTAVLELGCGTANYLRALAERRTDVRCVGLDLSEPMLREASRLAPDLAFVRGDASDALPFPDERFGLAFCVDVIHHLDHLATFFAEAHRVLAPGARLIVVTDSESTLKRRALTRFFPEILSIELARYPPLSRVFLQAERAGLRLESESEASGEIPLDDQVLARLEAKCSSAMRLITEDDHRAGIERVRLARARGESWFSCYDVLQYARPF